MKTTFTSLKNKTLGLKKLLVLLFMSCSFMAAAQPGGCNASFLAVDSAGYTYFMNTSTGGPGLSCSWDFGDGTTGTSSGDIIHMYSWGGTFMVYYACLTITSPSGCVDTFCDTITSAGGTGGGGSGSCYAYFVGNDSLGTTYFTNYSSGTGTITYAWDFGDGSTSTLANPYHTYTASGTYYVCLYMNDGSCSNTYCDYITIGGGGGGGTTCDASFTIVQDSTNIYNYFVYLNSSAPSGSTTYSYYWDFGDGATSTAPYPSHTYTGSGPYNLCLTVVDTMFFGATCTDTYCDSLIPGLAMMTNTTISVVPTGISEELNSIASLENYPNPFANTTTVSYTLLKDADIELNILGLLGNKVATLEQGHKSAGSYSGTWNAEGVAKGMYLMQMKAGNNVSTKKIILSH
jgi:PKD repeat protein